MKVPLKETLMFSLIVLGLMILAFSLYFIAAVHHHYYRYVNFTTLIGFAMIFYALRAEDNRKYLTVLIILLIFLMFLTIAIVMGFNFVAEILGLPNPDSEWAPILMTIALVSLVITVTLYPMTRA